MPTQTQILEAEELAQPEYDAGDPQAVNEARKKAGRKVKAERDLLARLMANEDGRKLMYGSVRCILEGNPIVPADPYSTYFNLGQEHRARSIFKEIVKITPDLFVLMMNENAET